MIDKELDEINKSLKPCGIRIIGYKKLESKTELETIISMLKQVFCFDFPKGNQEIVKKGKWVIRYLKKQDKLIKKYKI